MSFLALAALVMFAGIVSIIFGFEADSAGLTIFLFVVFMIAGLIIFSISSNATPANADNLTRNYVLKYYPEYSNCTITYSDDLTPTKPIVKTPGALIVCLEQRDSLIPLSNSGSTIQLAFRNFTLNDLAKRVEMDSYTKNRIEGDSVRRNN